MDLPNLPVKAHRRGWGWHRGLSVKFIEAGSGDLVIIHNSGRFRTTGRGEAEALQFNAGDT